VFVVCEERLRLRAPHTAFNIQATPTISPIHAAPSTSAAEVAAELHASKARNKQLQQQVEALEKQSETDFQLLAELGTDEASAHGRITTLL
jgi:hypothetical protein